MRRSQIRDHILDTALRLFNQHGYHATGIDLIVAETGVAKTTVYRHFKTKEDLVVAALNRRDEQAREAMRAFVDRSTVDPGERLLSTFDFLQTWISTDEFRGCLFMNAAGEHGDVRHAVFRAAEMHKRLVLAYFEELAHAARFADPRRVATEINLLHEGATAVAQITRKTDAAACAKRVAARLIAAEPRHSQSNPAAGARA